ncbi:pilus assembly protein Flp/PilA [Paenarthrobacter nicotinovorans]|uniref:Flp family type IVb pilin n=1 Tax=Micrococcaceae TaxID=1268 RepID=UPI00087734D5|nr:MULTISPECIES: Flp family type IVb pilin [Micrococcaceae]MDR6435601.1 pilus assembly protein Flp/PilA [Paenarthrobacter nicotinovorans]SCZ50169.1 pilus assembly protein Flp/PilA [Arthrobacter sp. UNCCL28]
MSAFMLSVTSYIAGVKARLTSEEKGATMVEYGIMVASIAVVVAVAALALGGRVSTLFAGIIP